MTPQRRITAFIAGFAALAVFLGIAAWAGTTPLPQDQREDAFTVFQQDIRPTIRLAGLSAWRSSSLASRALANAEDLELTDEQIDAISDTRRAHRRSEIRRDADMEIAELEIEEMTEDDQADLDAVEQKLRELANLQVDDRMADMRLDRTIRGILTVEQFDQLGDLDPVRVIYQSFRDGQRRRQRDSR